MTRWGRNKVFFSVFWCSMWEFGAFLWLQFGCFYECRSEAINVGIKNLITKFPNNSMRYPFALVALTPNWKINNFPLQLRWTGINLCKSMATGEKKENLLAPKICGFHWNGCTLWMVFVRLTVSNVACVYVCQKRLFFFTFETRITDVEIPLNFGMELSDPCISWCHVIDIF